MIALVDNYDSFTFNLLHALAMGGGVTVSVVRNDEVDVDEMVEHARAGTLEGVVLGPGPHDPLRAGASLALIERLAGLVPVLGVCLGHQCLAHAFGGAVVRAAHPTHGRASAVFHDGRGIFTGLPSPFEAARYHSLAVDPQRLPACLEVSAWTVAGEVMALRHRALPLEGVQFHPESVLTPEGPRLLANWLVRMRADAAQHRGAD